MQCYKKLLCANAVDKQWGLYITSLGHIIGKPSAGLDQRTRQSRLIPDEDAGADDYYIVFFAKGYGIVKHPQLSFGAVEPGSCILLFPGILPEYKHAPDKEWEMYWIGFNGNYAMDLMSGGIFSDRNPLIPTGMNEQILTLFETLFLKVSAAETGYRQMISGLTLQILALLYNSSAFEPEHPGPGMTMVSKAKYLLHQSVERPGRSTKLPSKPVLHRSSISRTSSKRNSVCRQSISGQTRPCQQPDCDG